MATLDVKFTKFDNRPWGFRLAGGSDFPQPLTVIRVTEGSLAECMGLKVGDVIVKLNDQPISELTHGQVHEALMLAGNNFVLGVRRTEDPSKSIEGIEEKIEPYMLPIEEILFAPIEEKREETPDEVSQIQDEAVPAEPEAQLEVETYPEKPRDENSDLLPNKNLTDEEIAQLILDEEEVLNEKGVLGVNFKKLRPRVPLLKDSKVFQELQKELSSEPVQVQELKRQTTFLQKPERPVPKARSRAQSEESKPEPEPEPYKVVIKKQPKKSVAERLVEKGLLEPSRVKTPSSEVTQPDPESSAESEPESASSESEPESEPVEPEAPPARGTWSFTSRIDDEPTPSPSPSPEPRAATLMLPINEQTEEPTAPRSPSPTFPISSPCPLESDSMTILPTPLITPTGKKVSRARLCRRGRYAKRCLERALDGLKGSSPGAGKTKPRLLRRARYFERIVRDVGRTLGAGAQQQQAPEPNSNSSSRSEESFLRMLMLASLASSLRDTYDAEILHRGSSRRNSRRASSVAGSRRESNASEVWQLENGLLAYRPAQKEQDAGLAGFTSRCACEGKRRLSVVSMLVADKVNSAMRSDVARGLAYALLPCASALAFFVYNYAKRINERE